MGDSVILRKSYAFALGIVKVCKELQHDKKEYILSKQLLRAGTSVGYPLISLSVVGVPVSGSPTTWEQFNLGENES